MNTRPFHVPLLLKMLPPEKLQLPAYVAAVRYFSGGEGGPLFRALAEALRHHEGEHAVLFALLVWAEADLIPFATKGARSATLARARKISERLTGARC